MKTCRLPVPLVIFAGWLLLAGCNSDPAVRTEAGEREILHIYPDGSMTFRGRPIPAEDVVIYEDGYGGERAAVRIRMEPLHPDFFRDTIVVERVRVIRENDDSYEPSE